MAPTATLLQSNEGPSTSGIELAPDLPAIALAHTGGGEPTRRHRRGQSSDLRRGGIGGFLAKHEDGTGPAVLIVADGTFTSRSSVFRDSAGNVVEFDLDTLVQTVVAAFRHHPHINNVMTHICGAQWAQVGQALRVILNPLATRNDLSPLAQNVVELMCAERGVTGRILKPYFQELLARILPPQLAAYLLAHVLGLVLPTEPGRLLPSSGATEACDRAIAPEGGG